MLRGLCGTGVDELEGVERAAARPEVGHFAPTLPFTGRPHAHEGTSTAGGSGAWGQNSFKWLKTPVLGRVSRDEYLKKNNAYM